MKKLHILFVGIHNKLGGIETYMNKVLQHIDLSRFQIDFLSFKGVKPCFYDEFLAKGCKFHFITSRKDNCLKNIRDIRILYKKEKFDIVHCHLNSLSYITPCVESCKSGIPVIVHSRNAAIIANPLSRILHNVNFHRLQKLPIVRVAVSDLAGQWMFGKKNFLVLNNGIDPTRYIYSEKSRNDIRKELNIDDNAEVFLNVGAFRPQKNHHFIIRLFAEYLKFRPTAVLLLVGDGALRKEVEDKAVQLGVDKNVLFLGLRKDIPQILSAADKFLFPSFYEGFPNALLEAECCGLQCIVSDSITKQAVIPELCETVSLDAPIDEWVKIMSRNRSADDRKYAVLKIKELGFDTDSEMKKLSNLYEEIFKNKVLV